MQQQTTTIHSNEYYLKFSVLIEAIFDKNLEKANGIFAEIKDQLSEETRSALSELLANKFVPTEKSWYFWNRALAINDADAQCLMAINTLFFKPDSQGEAQYFLRLSADQGHIEAKYILGVLLLKEEETNGIGRTLLIEAIAHGHIKAKEDLGKYLYCCGTNNSWQKQEALNLIKQAAEQGYTSAELTLGKILLSDKSSQTDAIHFFRSAIDKGNRAAMLHLAHVYRNEGNAYNLPYKDKKEAYKLFTLAAMNGSKFEQKIRQNIMQEDQSEIEEHDNQLIF